MDSWLVFGCAVMVALTCAETASAGQLEVPKTLAEWQKQRESIRATLWQLLGDLPPRPAQLEVKTVKREERERYTLEKFQFENGLGATVYGYLCIPKGLTKPAPGILYNHYHGGEYDNGKEEILKKYPVDESPADAFTKRGYVVCAIDAYAFGERQSQGPAGQRENGGRTESALFKANIWQGRVLWGMMVRDDQLALDYLCSRPEVDPKRIGATGMSMGSTRTWWLAALDERIRASVCVCCLTRYTNLIEHGDVNAHGIYYFVPDLLKHFDTEAVVSLIAPRPLITLTGDKDAGSPVDGVRVINETAEKVYELYGQSRHFRGVVYEGVGHDYTDEMWGETLRWFDLFLCATV